MMSWPRGLVATTMVVVVDSDEMSFLFLFCCHRGLNIAVNRDQSTIVVLLIVVVAVVLVVVLAVLRSRIFSFFSPLFCCSL